MDMQKWGGGGPSGRTRCGGGARPRRRSGERRRRRVRGRPPKRAAPENGKEAAAESPLEQRPEEAPPAAESVKQRLDKPPQTRLRPHRRRAPECQTEEEAPAAADLEQQRRRWEVEHAVPIGEPVTITGSGRRGRNQRRHYASFEYNGLTFELVKRLLINSSVSFFDLGEFRVSCLADDRFCCFVVQEDSVLITPEKRSQKPYAAIIKGITETEGSLTVTGQWFYRPHEAEIEEGKFCIARDTRELFYSFHIDEVPAESVMHKYKALTGQESRDRWLDRLLESIPLAWSKEITAQNLRVDPGDATKGSSNLSPEKIVASNDKDKSYGLNDVVPIIVALERSAHEAIGITDSGKYNQKLRHLWYNIKNSSKLRGRLMEKELDPRVLLTMSPDELKMTGARCERCQEKKVGVSDIIQAGHRDRYQLECTSCGHTWFSSYDVIPSLSADSACTATVIGNTDFRAAALEEAAAHEEPQQISSSRNKEQQIRSDP
ncbi:hypothetical protein PR202_gb13687 [Eleusine coracana subsp. coracana]|uniref:BAH domain-containing protein n=1 Tax=Eleusine coracana subsp. coracana TaxID=191504 RepID=A0AAV5ER73_ELECO|nr:hypothetical protein PR202_gb13687 [Eleusine coracana subsp. coracana]